MREAEPLKLGLSPRPELSVTFALSPLITGGFLPPQSGLKCFPWSSQNMFCTSLKPPFSRREKRWDSPREKVERRSTSLMWLPVEAINLVHPP